ncbi:MAG: cobalamin biosynthesis protein CobQ [Hyperthermus sp.]|nr:MAG: cobalamin biosynthesis protein CobQ [Hyperthermus sp.]
MRVKLAVTGGKGGTGKSTVATNLAVLIARERKLVLADLDVEAPNDHILLRAGLENEEPVKIMLPFIDYRKCTRCGACAEVCDTGALVLTRDKTPYIIPRLCSGCRACYFVCPEKAIIEGQRIIGYTYHTRVSMKTGSFDLVTGVLREGEEHTPPVVLAARRRASKLAEDVVIVDTSAGTASHVAIALEGAKLAIAVTEPTPLGLHDLEAILRILDELGIEAWIAINKWGIASSEKIINRITEIARDYHAEIKAKIPYSRDIVDAYVKGTPIVEADPSHKVSMIFESLAREVIEVI